MPPNHKSEFSTNDLPTLNNAQIKQLVVAETPDNYNGAASYWEWPADSQVIQLQSTYDLMSATHIEENLRRDAAAADSVAAVEQQQKVKDTDESRLYWDMPSVEPTTKEIPSVVFQSIHLSQRQPKSRASSSLETFSYWDFPAQNAQEARATDLILEGHRARHLTSTATLEANLLRQSAANPQSAVLSAIVPTNDSDWVF